MTDLADLTANDFSPHAGSRFLLHHRGGGEPISLELVEVNAGAQALRRGRQAFSLLFRGPLRPGLPQSIYRLEHEAMGALEIFLVPMTPEPAGALYEAVFT
jgi:Domain of unknown function (DUF6916)